MSKHNPRTAREFAAVLDKAGLESRQNGTSHVTYKLPDGRLLTFPSGHGGAGRELSPGLRCHLVKVLRAYGLIAIILILVVPVAYRLLA